MALRIWPAGARSVVAYALRSGMRIRWWDANGVLREYEVRDSIGVNHSVLVTLALPGTHGHGDRRQVWIGSRQDVPLAG